MIIDTSGPWTPTSLNSSLAPPLFLNPLLPSLTCMALSFAAPEENGRQDQEVPDLEQWGFCHPEQVHEVRGDRQFDRGACALLPATHPPVPGHHLLGRRSCKPSIWRRGSSRREKATASPATGSDWTMYEWAWKQMRTSPNTSAPPKGWACACSPMSSLWWFFPSVNEKTKQNKKQGSMCFFFFFPQLSPSFTVSPSHSSPHIHGCFSGPPPKMVTSYLVPRCDLRTKVQRSRKVWPCPKMSARPDRHASTYWLLHLLWLPAHSYSSRS